MSLIAGILTQDVSGGAESFEKLTTALYCVAKPYLTKCLQVMKAHSSNFTCPLTGWITRCDGTKDLTPELKQSHAWSNIYIRFQARHLSRLTIGIPPSLASIITLPMILPKVISFGKIENRIRTNSSMNGRFSSFWELDSIFILGQITDVFTRAHVNWNRIIIHSYVNLYW